MTQAMEAFTSEVRAALKEHASRMCMAPIISGDSVGVATLDTTGRRPNLVVLKCDASGDLSYGRAPMADRNLARADRAAVQMAVDNTEMPEPSALGNIGFSAALDWFGLRNKPSGFAKRFAKSFAVTYPNLHVDESAVIALIDSNLQSWGIGAVAEHVDQEALKALGSASEFSKAAYSFYATASGRRADRLQAAAAYPLLAKSMAEKILVKIAIDRRQPLGPMLETAFGVGADEKPLMSKGILRRLQGVAWKDAGVPVEALVNTLSALPPDWFPKTEIDWDAFVAIADAFFRVHPSSLGQRPDELAAGCSGKWAEFRSRLAKAYVNTLPPNELTDEQKATWKPAPDESPKALKEAGERLLDMVRAFRDTVVLPIASQRSMDDLALSQKVLDDGLALAGHVLCRGKSLPAMLEMQRQWHVNQGIMAAAVEQVEQENLDVVAGRTKEVTEDGWPPMCDVIEAPNGVTIMPLTDVRELEDEGAGWSSSNKFDRNGVRGLNHCVSTHANQARKGYHIISFRLYDRDGSFTRLSTAEFHPLKEDSNTLSPTQHMGYGNGAAPAISAEAYEWFVHEVEVGNIQVNRAGTMSYLSSQRRDLDDFKVRAGYDRKDPELVAKSLETWQPFLTKKWRGKGPAALNESPEFEPVVEDITPSFAPSLR